MVYRQIVSLMHKELMLEWRQKHALGGIMLYLVSTIFICYLSFAGMMTIPTWNALFWIIIAFASLNLVLKSFQDENGGRKLYFYTLASPTAIIFSKILTNSMVMIVLGIVGFVLFNLFMGNLATANAVYWTVLITGVTGFSSVLTMVSAIAGQTRNNFTLMAVLGFPLILPLLLLLIRSSLAAIQGAAFAEIRADLLVIILLVIISLVLSNILFPYLWKE